MTVRELKEKLDKLDKGWDDCPVMCGPEQDDQLSYPLSQVGREGERVPVFILIYDVDREGEEV